MVLKPDMNSLALGQLSSVERSGFFFQLSGFERFGSFAQSSGQVASRPASQLGKVGILTDLTARDDIYHYHTFGLDVSQSSDLELRGSWPTFRS